MAEGIAGGGGGGLRPLLVLGFALVALLAAGAFVLGQVNEAVLLSSPEVRQAQAHEAVALANRRAAEAEAGQRAVEQQAATSAAWEPWVAGAGQLALVAVLLVVPLLVAGGLVGAGLLVRRHLSLPTADGRVPLVGLDREFSREALARYQLRAGGGAVGSFETWPLAAERPPRELLEAAPEA